MATTRLRSDVSRAWLSTLIATPISMVGIVALTLVTEVDLTARGEQLTVAYVVLWPVYTAIYVGWSTWVYARLEGEDLRAAMEIDEKSHRSWLGWVMGSGTAGTTVAAAIVAVVVTVVIAQRPDLLAEPVYVALTLLTVVGSWVLMVFAFASAYLALTVAPDRPHLRFHVEDEPRFTDCITLAVLISTMAATTSADISSRHAWGLVRMNVVVGFCFNTVIIALLVSTVFGGISG